MVQVVIGTWDPDGEAEAASSLQNSLGSYVSDVSWHSAKGHGQGGGSVESSKPWKGGGRWKGCLRLQVKQTRKHIPAFEKEGTSSSTSKFVQFVVGGYYV